MGFLKLEDGKESEDHLSHCLANVVNGFPGKAGTSLFNLIIFFATCWSTLPHCTILLCASMGSLFLDLFRRGIM